VLCPPSGIITLIILFGLHSVALPMGGLSLYVPRSEERFYRDAGEEIATTLRIYRYKYPNRSDVPAEGYLAMTAIDIATRYKQVHTALEARKQTLTPRLVEINEELEALIRQARQLIDDPPTSSR